MAVRRDPGVQALTRGLEILDLLLDAARPMTGSEIAGRVGLHESSVSRILQTLVRSGYVSRVPGGNVPALRMLRFARVTDAFPMIGRVRPVLEEIAAAHPRHHVNLCAYAQGDLTYLLRALDGAETITGLSFPLHTSSAAMRLLVDVPEDEALVALRRSRSRHGWNGGPQLPADESAALAWARDHVRHDVLVLRQWHGDATSGAITLDTRSQPMVLAIGGFSDTDPKDLHLWLHDARRRVEDVLRSEQPPSNSRRTAADRPTSTLTDTITNNHPTDLPTHAVPTNRD